MLRLVYALSSDYIIRFTKGGQIYLVNFHEKPHNYAQKDHRPIMEILPCTS